MESNKRINVYGYVFNNTPDGIVALSQQIYDESTGIKQDVLNRTIPSLFDGFVEVSNVDIHNETPEVEIIGIYYNRISKTFIAKGEDDQYYSRWSTWAQYMKNVFLIDDKRIFISEGELYTVDNILNEETEQEESIIAPVREEKVQEIDERLEELEDTSVKQITVSGTVKEPDQTGNITIPVDATLNNTSVNPIQNKAVKKELDKTVRFHTVEETRVVDSEYKITADNVLDPQTGAEVLDTVQDMIEDFVEDYVENHLPSPDHTMYTYPKFEVDPETMHLYMIITSETDRGIITLEEDGHLYYNVQT